MMGCLSLSLIKMQIDDESFLCLFNRVTQLFVLRLRCGLLFLWLGDFETKVDSFFEGWVWNLRVYSKRHFPQGSLDACQLAVF